MSRPFNLAEFFETEGPRLRRFLRRVEPIWADDIAQEAFARLAAADPAGLTSPRGFLFRVARNLAVDAVRRRRASPERAVADIEMYGAATWSASPEESAIASDRQDAILAAIETLSEHQRQAFTLRKVEELATSVIAERLGVTPRQVQRLVAEASAALQARLERDW